jgi:dienelactone hydrolase
VFILSCFNGAQMALMKWVVAFWLVPAIAYAAESAPPAVQAGSTFAAADTLACGTESNPDAKDCLANLSWTPTKFTVDVENAGPGGGDYLVRFPSARPIGNATNDRVAMEWFAARDADNAIRKAPAVVVVHESGSRMTVGRLIARGIRAQGVHAFLLHLPGYGARRVRGIATVDRIIPLLHQGIADTRRARDAVVALPAVDRSVVGLQGTSLGGFVAATVAGLDHGYNRVFIVLAGGNLADVLFNGSKELAKARKRLADAGITDKQIRDVAHQVEPLRLAHRINPAETWLYSGKFDCVVPPRCAVALAKAAHLPDGHHIEIPADHYTGIIYLPQVILEISQRVKKPLGQPTGMAASHEDTRANETPKSTAH